MSGPTGRSAFTKTFIDGLVPSDKEIIVWASDPRNLGVRISPSGTKTFIVQYRLPSGQQRRLKLGRTDSITTEQAKRSAREALGQVAGGVDPGDKKRAMRASLTFRALWDEYYQNCKDGLVLGRNKQPKTASTIEINESRARRHLLPLLGNKKIVDITASDILAARDAIATGKTAVDEKTRSRGRARVTGGKATASASIKLCGAMFTYAVAREYLDDNVVRKVTTFGDNQRKIFITPEEYVRLGETMRQARASGSINATALDQLQYIVLTGDRRGEAQSLATGSVDIERQCRVLAKTKTGMSVRPIGAAACDHLRNVNAGEQHFFPSTRGTAPYFIGLPKIWKRVSILAGLPPKLTIHGLRHGFAGWAAELGYTEPTIKALLGHRRAGVTQGYIIRPDRALVKAANDVAGHIARMMAGDTRWPDQVIDATVEITLEPELRQRLTTCAGMNKRSLSEEVIALLDLHLDESGRGPEIRNLYTNK
ncbi:tyrosine-type recombinase/integrase [Sandarakinorhabdus sp. DWP1-3-1]|uniref:tyrosine-type recombinase/integrase n=1 Tax=Sandarakinorhabdus sp. DWP1-3-1 TaxID=2804627 RepID=UPI003CFA02B3